MKTKGRPVLNLKGKRFGKLVALYSYKKGNETGRMWHCLCDCGNTKDVRVDSLSRGETTHCGCSRPIPENLIDITGQRFGMLVAVSWNNPGWLLKCDCGNEVVRSRTSLKNAKKSSCGCLRIQHNFDGVPEHKKQRHRQLMWTYGIGYPEFIRMFEQQDYKCKICKLALTEGEAKLDHCHDSNNIRGILCDLCNRGLGYFRDNPTTLIAAADYVLNV